MLPELIRQCKVLMHYKKVVENKSIGIRKDVFLVDRSKGKINLLKSKNCPSSLRCSSRHERKKHSFFTSSELIKLLLTKSKPFS